MSQGSTSPAAQTPPRALPPRVIARLDVKAPNLVKGIHLEGFRVIGSPEAHALGYYEQGADELLYMDIVASLYQRNNIVDLVARTASEVFVPLTVGGGVRKVDDVYALLRAGADKVAINTGAVHNPALLRDASRVFGSQCVVLSIEAKKTSRGWEAYTDNGRERTGLDVLEWVKRGVDAGAGEILVTSVDQEGTRRGLDLELIRAVASCVPVPLIACGGAGTPRHVVEGVLAGADGVAVASLLHYREATVRDVKGALSADGFAVRA
jgi:cyclase